MKKKAEKGLALLTVLIAVMIITIMLFEFQFSSMVERKLAYNELDQLQAYYLAKSGARIGLLRVALYGRAIRNKGLPQIPGIDLQSYMNKIWSIRLPAFPSDASAIAKMGKKEDQDAAKDLLNQTRISQGKASHVVTSESAKFNLNSLSIPASTQNQQIDLRGTPKNLVEYIGRALINLMDGFLRASEKPSEEYGDLKPEEVVYDIMDWVSPGSTSFSGGHKDNFYEQQIPPYKAKRNRLYTVEELKMVKSITPLLYKKLRPHVTVYSYDGKINLNEASRDLIKAFYQDFTDEDLTKIEEEKNRRNGWAKEEDFVTFVTSTLGRSGFTTLYNDKNQYPFSVGTLSFLVEGQGIIPKSDSAIVKTIRVAVALTAKGGSTQSPQPVAKGKGECDADQNLVWVTGIEQCYPKPTDSTSCTAMGGQVTKSGNQDQCKLTNKDPIAINSGGGNKGDPNKMRILYWAES